MAIAGTGRYARESKVFAVAADAVEIAVFPAVFE